MEKLIISKMLEEGANTRIHGIDTHQGCTVGGMLPDGKHLVQRAREEARQFLQTYGIPITGDMLVQRLCSYMHFFTISWYRPFGAALMIASYGTDGPQLYVADPHGAKQSFNACAIGKASTRAKTELEKVDFKTITAREALDVIARLLYEVHDYQKVWRRRCLFFCVPRSCSFFHHPFPPHPTPPHLTAPTGQELRDGARMGD